MHASIQQDDPLMGRGVSMTAGYSSVFDALEFAARCHRLQRRKDADASPYINHLISVASTLATVGGVQEPKILISALLHDTLEDTTATPEQLEALFGRPVRMVVEELTDDTSLPSERRKAAQVERSTRLSMEARLIKLADKLCNVRDLSHAPPMTWSDERKRRYVAWADSVVGHCRGLNSALEEEYDRVREEALRQIGRASKQV